MCWAKRKVEGYRKEAWEIWGKSAPEKECSMQSRCELSGLSNSKVTVGGAEGKGTDGHERNCKA